MTLMLGNAVKITLKCRELSASQAKAPESLVWVETALN